MTPADAKTFEGKGLAPASGWKSAVEMIDENGTHAFSGQASTSDSGSGGSRGSQATMPMDIKFNDAIGTSSISYPIFHQKPGLTSFKKLRLRNSGSDYAQAHIRDQYWQGVGVDAGLVGSATEPVQVFVNGHYYGMMDLREREDETLISSSLPGVDKDNVQYLSDSTVLSGENSKADYDAMVSFIAHNDMTLAANYQKAAALLDLDNLAEDYALHVFAADCDFGPHNLHMFRALDYDGRWRYRPHDFDIASSWISGPSGWCNSSPSSPNFSYSGSAPGLMIAALLKNPAFKARYANIVADQLNTALSSSALTARLDDLSVPVASYLPNQIAANGQPVSMPAWSGNIQRIRTFVTTRQPYYDKGVQSRLAIGPRKPVQLSVNDPAMGTIAVNTLDLDQFLTAANPTWTGSYYGEFPITVVAKPRPGYAFVGWQGADTSSSQTIHPTIVAGSPTYRANFAPIAAPVAPIVSSVADQTGQTGDLASLQVDAHDPNLYPLTYSAKLPNGLNINPA